MYALQAVLYAVGCNHVGANKEQNNYTLAGHGASSYPTLHPRYRLFG